MRWSSPTQHDRRTSRSKRIRGEDHRKSRHRPRDPGWDCATRNTRIYVNPTGPIRYRRPEGRCRVDRTQNHRRYLWRNGASRRRRLLGQRSDEGRSLGCVRGPGTLRRTSSRRDSRSAARCRSRTRSASRIPSPCSSRRSARASSPMRNRRPRYVAFRLAAGGDHPPPRPASADLQADGVVRSLRPSRTRSAVGTHEQGGRTSGRRGLKGEAASAPAPVYA